VRADGRVKFQRAEGEGGQRWRASLALTRLERAAVMRERFRRKGVRARGDTHGEQGCVCVVVWAMLGGSRLSIFRQQTLSWSLCLLV
jgi:hypothetical protein